MNALLTLTALTYIVAAAIVAWVLLNRQNGLPRTLGYTFLGIFLHGWCRIAALNLLGNQSYWYLPAIWVGQVALSAGVWVFALHLLRSRKKQRLNGGPKP